MSILISDMEMPKNEAVALYIYPDGRAKLWRPQAAVGHELEAVSVQPHGRLIDADVLVDKHFGKEFLSKVMTADEDDLRTALINVPLVINNTQTIIPASEGE